MIPSDHFVKFYNEIFKFLQQRGPEAVKSYYDTIANHQKEHCLENFRTNGLQGMYNYWSRIKFEENCDCDIVLEDGAFNFIMHGCPSLGKVLDNDGGASQIYCDHCPGWVLPLITAAGFYCVYDLVGKEIPRCQMKIFENLEDAKKHLALVKKRHPEKTDCVLCNF